MSQPVYGTIVNYRIGIRTQMSKECLIQFAHVNSISLAGPLIGRKVVWKGGKNKLIGKIVGLHGKKGWSGQNSEKECQVTLWEQLLN